MEKLISNEEIEEKALKLVKSIKENKDYKEYLELREKLKSNKEIMDLIDEVKSLQKAYVKSAYLDNSIKQKLDNKLKLEGYTLIPLKLYFVRGKAKIELGLCKGKKNYDKRESIKERDLKREAAKINKYK